MKKLNLITLTILALAISTTAVKAGPHWVIRIKILKSAPAPAQIRAFEKKVTTFKPEGFTNPDIHISPSSDFLNVSTSSNQDDLMFKLYDLDGNEIAQSEIKGGQTRLSMDELPAGEYIARTSLKSGGIVNVQKIQLMR